MQDAAYTVVRQVLHLREAHDLMPTTTENLQKMLQAAQDLNRMLEGRWAVSSVTTQNRLNSAQQATTTLSTLRKTLAASERRAGELSTEVVDLRRASEVKVKALHAKLHAGHGKVFFRRRSLRSRCLS